MPQTAQRRSTGGFGSSMDHPGLRMVLWQPRIREHLSADRQQHAITYPAGAVAPEITHRSEELWSHGDHAGTSLWAVAQPV